MASAMVMYTKPVPRSGWAMTSIAGTSASSMIRLVVSRSPSRRMRSTTKADSVSTSSTLPSSEVCSWKKPRSMARLEPRVTEPAANTATIPTIMKAYRPTRPLAQP